MTRVWNVAERVFHDKYLWMEVAKWDLDVYRALSKITRADQSDTLAYRKHLVMGMLKVYIGRDPVYHRCSFIIIPVNSADTDCLNDGICYIAGTGVNCNHALCTNAVIMSNPFGPVYYHLCHQTAQMTFSSAVRMIRYTDYTWSVWHQNSLTYTGQNKNIDEMLTVYRDNPFADFWPVPELMKLRA